MIDEHTALREFLTISKSLGNCWKFETVFFSKRAPISDDGARGKPSKVKEARLLNTNLVAGTLVIRSG